MKNTRLIIKKKFKYNNKKISAVRKNYETFFNTFKRIQENAIIQYVEVCCKKNSFENAIYI